jgi:hypothetical protein
VLLGCSAQRLVAFAIAVVVHSAGV